VARTGIDFVAAAVLVVIVRDDKASFGHLIPAALAVVAFVLPFLGPDWPVSGAALSGVAVLAYLVEPFARLTGTRAWSAIGAAAGIVVVALAAWEPST
jgi:predicted branched-subunit amino acid permease